MAIQIYKVTRQGGMSLRFHGPDGTDFTDPNGLRNPQLAKIIGNKLMTYVKCEIGNATAEVLDEASAAEIAEYEKPATPPNSNHSDDSSDPYRLFPQR